MSLSFQRCTTCGKSSEIHESGLCMSCFSTRKRILDEAKERSVIAPVSEEPPVKSCSEMSHYREGSGRIMTPKELAEKYPRLEFDDFEFPENLCIYDLLEDMNNRASSILCDILIELSRECSEFFFDNWSEHEQVTWCIDMMMKITDQINKKRMGPS